MGFFRHVIPLLLILVLPTVASAADPFSGNLTAAWKCESCCIEGFPITVYINITNSGLTNYVVTEYRIETSGSVRLAIVRDVQLNLNRGDMLNLSITRNITNDIYNNSLRFRPCFEYKYWDMNMWKTDEVCALNYYNLTAYLLSNYYSIGIENICCSNDECNSNEQCASNYICSTFGCGSCQYISNHICVSWECCANEDCNDTFYCAEHNCLPVPCFGQITNHTCVGFVLPSLPMLPGSQEVISAIITFFGNNILLFFFGIIFTIVFIVLLVWLFRSGMPKGKQKEEKPKEKEEKKEKKKKKGEKGEPEFVPLVELPE